MEPVKPVTLWRDEMFSRERALVLSEIQREGCDEEWRALPVADFDALTALRESSEAVTKERDALKAYLEAGFRGGLCAHHAEHPFDEAADCRCSFEVKKARIDALLPKEIPHARA